MYACKIWARSDGRLEKSTFQVYNRIIQHPPAHHRNLAFIWVPVIIVIIVFIPVFVIYYISCSVSLSVCLCVCTPLFSTRSSDCNQIWHAYLMRIDLGIIRTITNLTNPPQGDFRGQKFKGPGNVRNWPANQYKNYPDPTPTGGGVEVLELKIQKSGKFH